MDTNGTAANNNSGAHERQKFIRTFEGDIKTLKEGGVPDLAPLKKTPPPDAAPKASSPPPIPVLPKIQAPPPPPLAFPQTPQEFSAPPPPPIPPTFVQAPPTPLETYSGDFSDRVKETHSSMATVLAAEQDMGKRESEPQERKTSLANILYAVVGVMLLIAGGTAAYIAYENYQASMQPVAIAPVVSSPIFVDDREKVMGTGHGLFQAISASAEKPLSNGAVRLLYIETATTSPDSVFSALRMPLPDILSRNIRAENSMAGIVNAGGTQTPFFILAVDSYSDTFAGMLRWEADMPEDLKHMFPPYTTPAPEPTTIATSTSATSTASVVRTASPAPIPKPRFIDEVVANHDVRAYRDAAGESIVLYGYWDQKTLVIARDPAAFGHILQRLANSRAK